MEHAILVNVRALFVVYTVVIKDHTSLFVVGRVAVDWIL